MERQPDEFVLAAAGDVALLRRPSQDLYRDGWDSADLRIANLEAPLLADERQGVPAAKLVRLKSPPQAAEWVRDDLRCDAVSLANNHIMDWGEPGLRSTLEALDAAGIQYAGAGLDAASAGAHRLLRVGDRSVALLSWACTVPPGFRATERQAGLAAVRVRTSYAADPFLIDEQPGTPPWVHTDPVAEDVAALEAALGRARAEADFVVLALHWGVPPQWQSAFQGPLAEYQQTLAPRLVEAGADLVLGHHAHTVYGVESFERTGGRGSGLVCYSLGNYVFHPLAGREGIVLDAPTRAYHAPERLENRETFVGTFRIGPGADGRLVVREARLRPALLDEAWEARAPDPAVARRIADRLKAFCDKQGTTTSIAEDATVVWERAHA